MWSIVSLRNRLEPIIHRLYTSCPISAAHPITAKCTALEGFTIGHLVTWRWTVGSTQQPMYMVRFGIVNDGSPFPPLVVLTRRLLLVCHNQKKNYATLAQSCRAW